MGFSDSARRRSRNRRMVEQLDEETVGIVEVERAGAVAMSLRGIRKRNLQFLESASPLVHILGYVVQRNRYGGRSGPPRAADLRVACGWPDYRSPRSGTRFPRLASTPHAYPKRNNKSQRIFQHCVHSKQYVAALAVPLTSLHPKSTIEALVCGEFSTWGRPIRETGWHPKVHDFQV